MNKKTIKKTLENKLIKWTDSITDKSLAKEVLNNSIVTGGCIASMLLNEQVNDYDIYIADRDVLYKLMKYYGNGHDILDGNKKDYLLNGIEDTKSGYKISVENLEKDQLKYYIYEGGKTYIEKNEEVEPGSYKVAYLSPNAISLTDKIQIVVRFHGDPKEIHTNYDFVHATNYFTIKDGLVLNDKALASLLTKTLYYTGSKYPITSIIRMKKFLKRGFNINAGEIFKMVYQSSLLDLRDPKVLEEQLIGVDIAYFFQLIEALRNIEDENKLTETYIFKIIDKIFNE